MFCHNCGKNCGDELFCSACGTKIVRTVERITTEPMEQPCSCCGGTETEGDHCASCSQQFSGDAQLGDQKEQDLYQIPYDAYGTASNLVKLTKEFLIVHSKPLFQKKVIAKISYDQLVKVIYSRDKNDLRRMHFYWNDNGAEKQISIMFPTWYNEVCYEELFHLFMVIKVLVPSSVTFIVDIPSSDAQNVDFDSYFAQFAPYRRRAIDTLVREYAFSKEIATPMVNSEFERRQQEIYAANPSLAIRDLNLVVAERHRFYEEEERKRLERRIARARFR